MCETCVLCSVYVYLPYTMYTSVSGEELDVFSQPARILVAGASNSGKSFFVSRLVNKYHSKFKRIVIIGANLENVDGLNIIRDDQYNPLLESEGNEQSLVIFDDVIFNPRVMKIAAESFTRGRHMNVSLIFCTQNLFLADKTYRTITLNLTAAFLLRIRDSRQVSLYGNTFLPKEKINCFLELYKQVVFKERKYGYLMIDFTKFSENPLALRSYIFEDEGYERAYQL